MDAVADIPTVSLLFDHCTAGSDRLTGHFILCNYIVAVLAVAQMTKQFHIRIQIFNFIQR